MVHMTRNPGHRAYITPLPAHSAHPQKETNMSRTATPTEYIVLTGTRLRETDKAIHFRVEQVDGEPLEDSVTHWFPFSQINKQSYNPAVDSTDTISVAKWIVQSKELI